MHLVLECSSSLFFFYQSQLPEEEEEKKEEEKRGEEEMENEKEKTPYIHHNKELGLWLSSEKRLRWAKVQCP